jgi:Flp pilus assembly protein TadG
VKALLRAGGAGTPCSRVTKALAESWNGHGGKRSSIEGVCRLLNAGRDEGGSLVEFALIAPMMMLLITGVFSIGMMLSNYLMLINGVSAGARAFALSRGVEIGSGSSATAITDPCAYAITTAKQAAPNLNSSAATFSFTYTPAGSSSGTSYTTTCSGITLNSGDTVQMQAWNPVVMILYGWRPGNINISAQTTQLVQ